MKKLINILIMIILLAITNAYAQQSTDFVCAISNSTTYRSPSERGGLYITSDGTLEAIFIFIQFKDDTTQANNTTGWPITNPISGPSWLQNIAGSGQGVTHYFDEMSNSDLNLTGYVHPTVYVTQHDESYYSNLKYVNEEVLTALDPVIEYSDYDNWTGASEGSDGVVDMIFLIYRDFDNDLISSIYGGGWTGLADFQLPSNLTLDGVTIAKGFSGGSGVQMRGAKHGFSFLNYIAAHEFGHHLFGSGHIFGITRLGLMVGGPV